MPYEYDDQNVFARILRGEIPSTPVAESEHALAFPDITPQAPEHILVIPRGPYVTFDHFCAEASDAEIVDFHRLVARVCAERGLTAADGGEGHRAIANAGRNGVQEVPHYHLHLIGGRRLGRMLQPA
ncbi:HIT domain-containing protein [Jannaschia sp. W003]|uniref:HIT domain-containing protein n=1 Tax=Jannaschia sp. W003 TaxID=2867012 RepID=UPI0021A5B214|nr:HIT domain-containing protein [Jannaschia sp. W003]UWQ22307.1 HIT domain-containing protein [Jannaschia sp. W003]